jgi:hypothetical protein
MGSKKSPAPAAPQPTFTPVAQAPAQPIERAATSAEARDRAAGNPDPNLLAQQDEKAGTKAGIMSTY